MSVWWGITALLTLLLAIQFFLYRQKKKELDLQISENMRLESKLTDTRRDLAELNARRKKLLAASTQGLIIVERDGSISSANKVAKRIFGKFRKEEITLMRWTRQHQLHELVEHTLAGEKMPAMYFNAAIDQEVERRLAESGRLEAVRAQLARHRPSPRRPARPHPAAPSCREAQPGVSWTGHASAVAGHPEVGQVVTGGRAR